MLRGGPAGAEVENLIDHLLEVRGLLERLGGAFGQLAHPLRAHPDVGYLVGEDVIDRALDHFIAVALRDPNELIENVACKSFESAINSRDSRRRRRRLGASPQNFRLDIVAGMTTHVLDQALENLAVARFVPDVARHVELEFPRCVGKIEQRAAGRLHRLQFAGVDTVQTRAQRFFIEWHRAPTIEPLLFTNFADLAAAHHHPIVGTRESVNWNAFLHKLASSDSRAVLVRRAFAEAFDQAIDLFFGEAGQQTRLASNCDPRIDFEFLVTDSLLDLIGLFHGGTAATEVEQIIDIVLELLRLSETLGVAFSKLAHPLRAHPHVGDFVCQHVIDRTFDTWITHLLREPDQLLEAVAREALESAVDSRHPPGRIFGLRARPEHFALGKFAVVRADVFEQLQVDFRVARFVPDLTRHV